MRFIGAIYKMYMIQHCTKLKEKSFRRFSRRVFPFVLTLLLFSGKLFAQNITVNGTVKDNNGEPLIGVSIRVIGMKRATSTNYQGQFVIKAPENSTLEFSYLGFITQQVKIDSRTSINVVMKEDLRKLDEVVIVGYGTVNKSDITGAISSVKLKDVNETKAISVTEALQGKVSGVNIVTNTGEPGGAITFNIRGMTSITGSNQPLIVIDGQPIESSFGATSAGTGLDGGADIPPADPLASINTNDIASIEILKDASSTAIYGSRGANGVVLITTKSGSSGKDRVTYSQRWDISQLPKQLDMLSSYEYMMMKNEAATNSWNGTGTLNLPYSENQLDSISKTLNINWQDEVYRNALSQDHQLSFSGRSEKDNYLLSANYSDQQSIIQKAGFLKGGIRLNYERNVNDKLKIGLRNYFSLADRTFGLQSNWTGILGSSTVMGALSFNPLQNPYDPETGDIDENLANGPLLLINKVKDKTNIKTLLSNFSADYKISKSLTYSLTAAVNQIYSLRQLYYPRGTFIGNSAPNGYASRADNNNANYNIDNLLNFRKTFAKKHSVNAVGGFSYQQWFNNASSVISMGFPSDVLEYNNLEAAAFPGKTYTSKTKRALQSVIGRVIYAYDKKYSLTLTGRYDGSTRLAEGNKWQMYPSAGAAWTASSEEFFKENIKFVSLLKLRASVGVAGNDNIAVGASQKTYALNYYPFGSTITPTYVFGEVANPALTWEQTTKYNAGADLGFFKDRLSFSVDYYKHITTDLLLSLALPASAGIGSIYTNVGKIENHGFDIEGSYQMKVRNVNLNLGANFSTFDNKVINMGTGNVIYGRGFFAGGAIALNQPVTAAIVGERISNFYGYRTNGIYQNQAEIDNDPALANSNKAGVEPGMIKYVDINGDGQITGDDRTIIGSPTPDFNYGFNASVSYKRLSVNMTIFGSYGGELFNLNRWMVGSNHANTTYNLFQDSYFGRWRGEGTSNLYPRLTTESIRLQQRIPDWMVEDASFVRLQNLTLGYTFNMPKRLNTGGTLRLFFTGTNLITLTKYTGYDPNVNSFGQSSLNNGLDLGTLPQARSFSGGLTLTF